MKSKELKIGIAKLAQRIRTSNGRMTTPQKNLQNYGLIKIIKKIIPIQITEIIETLFGKHSIFFAFPEHITTIDSYKGGQRNHDMFLFCEKETGEDFVVCIEAKTSESLDMTILQKRTDNNKSNIAKRIEMMRTFLDMKNVDIEDLRYQVFTGLIGTIKEAEKYKTKECLFLIIQIIPNRNINKKIEKNYNDIKNFLIKNNARILKNEPNSYLIGEIITSNKIIKTYLGYIKINKTE